MWPAPSLQLKIKYKIINLKLSYLNWVLFSIPCTKPHKQTQYHMELKIRNCFEDKYIMPKNVISAE